jgi:hypothetical protein
MGFVDSEVCAGVEDEQVGVCVNKINETLISQDCVQNLLLHQMLILGWLFSRYIALVSYQHIGVLVACSLVFILITSFWIVLQT